MVACCRQPGHKQQGKPAIPPTASGALQLRGTPVHGLHPQSMLTSLWQTSLWIYPTLFEYIYIFDLCHHPVAVSSAPYYVWQEKPLPFILNLLLDSFTWCPSAPIFRETANNCVLFIIPIPNVTQLSHSFTELVLFNFSWYRSHFIAVLVPLHPHLSKLY